MKRILVAAIGFSAAVASGGTPSLAQQYAEYGQLMVTQLVSAPFPHPDRAQGHKYKEEFHSAVEHYSDSTVAIFIPKGFRETDRVDFVVHFHGWRNDVAGVLRGYKLIEQLLESGRNAVLIVPQGPRDAPDSFGGKLEDAAGFQRFMSEVVQTLKQRSSLRNRNFEVGRIILSGHSGGYQVISSILDRGGLTDTLSEVWLFDALYARTDKFLAWLERKQGRLMIVYTEHGGTKQETEQMMTTLKERGTDFFSGRESDLKLDINQRQGAVFLFTDLTHNDVLEKHRTFRDFLRTSCLAPRDQKP
jgi:hypothetical protein